MSNGFKRGYSMLNGAARIPSKEEIEASLNEICPVHSSVVMDHTEAELEEDLGAQLLLMGFDEQTRTTKDPETGELIELDDEAVELLLKYKKS